MNDDRRRRAAAGAVHARTEIIDTLIASQKNDRRRRVRACVRGASGPFMLTIFYRSYPMIRR
jgi:hypothetical protein